jgi:hypothetical protein
MANSIGQFSRDEISLLQPPHELAQPHAVDLWNGSASNFLNEKLCNLCLMTSIKGRIHALGMLSYFPNFFSTVNLWNRTRSRADKLADELTVLFPGLSINVYDNPVACVEDADVIVTATNSSTALFSAGDLKKSSVHINGELLNLLLLFAHVNEISLGKSILQNSWQGP